MLEFHGPDVVAIEPRLELIHRVEQRLPGASLEEDVVLFLQHQ
jgi:hypothetical protein